MSCRVQANELRALDFKFKTLRQGNCGRKDYRDTAERAYGKQATKETKLASDVDRGKLQRRIV